LAGALEQSRGGLAIMATAPRPVGPVLSLSVLGAPAIALAGRDLKIRSRKSRAILAYIALSENLRETRERLAGLFWSEFEEDKARASLRQTLRELRVVFAETGFLGFHTEKLAIEFEPSTVDVDLWSVLREAEAGRAHPLLLDRPRLADGLLDGFDDLDPSFSVWLLPKRQTLHDRLLRALEDALRDEAVDARARGRLAEAIINLDPTHEEACRYLMRAKTVAGDIGGALRVYKALWDRLDAEYDTEPSGETQRLVADIKTGTVERAAAPSPPALKGSTAGDQDLSAFTTGPVTVGPKLPAKIELCVEEFSMRGVEPGNAHLVDGFRRQLTACLIRFREWYVTDRSSRPSVGGIRPAVSASYAIEVTAYQSHTSLHLVLTLKEVGTNLYIWSDRLGLALENWFEAQQRVVRRVTMALNVELSTERLLRLAGQPGVTLEIYDRWLRGQSMIATFGSATRNEAADIFAGIIREASNFSPAYSSLAQINNANHIAFPGLFRNQAIERTSLDLARMAVQLDPMDSRAHLCLAWALIMAKQYSQAEAPIRSACELNENDPWTVISSALVLAFCAHFDRAGDLARQALDLSLSPSRAHWGYVATLRFLCGDYQGCVEAASLAGDVPGGRSGWVAAALFHLGHRKEAAEEAQRFLARIRANWFGVSSPTDETIMQWFLHAYPIRRLKDWERLRDGLAGAGVPVGSMNHHTW
jgi:DNA-binding SARP family transcriptional activator